MRNFDRKLANIAPYPPAGKPFSLEGNIFYSIKLHPTHIFMWEYKHIGGDSTNTT